MSLKKKFILIIPILIIILLILSIYFFWFYNKTTINFSDEELSVNPNLSPNVINIALLGIDERESDTMVGSRTDTIVVASINKDDSTVKLTTILRDTFVMAGIADKVVREEKKYTEDLDDKYNYLKLNSVYSLGGVPSVIKTLNLNFGLNITDYALLNFNSLREIIDLIDGVEVEIADQKTLEHINSLIRQINEDEGRNDPLIENTGIHTLTGAQALAYIRDRSYTNDEERTKKQREIIEQIYSRLKNLEVGAMFQALVSVYPEIETSLSVKDLISLLIQLKNQSKPFQSESIPLQEYSKTGVIGMIPYLFPLTLADNVSAMQKFIYGDQTPLPEAVKQISASLEEQYRQTKPG